MSTLVVEQRRKMFELRNQYRIFDESGDVAGTVEQVDQSAFAVLARFGTDLDVALPMTLEVKDAGDARVLRLEKPWFTRKFTVSRPDGTLVGSIAKQFRVGKARFTINDSIGTEMGEVRAVNWRARDFVVNDHAGTEVAQTSKKWRGLSTEMFTDADTYVVNIQPHISEPMRSLAMAATLVIDVILKQKDA